MPPSKRRGLGKWPEPLWKTWLRPSSEAGGRRRAPSAAGSVTTNLGRTGRGPLPFRSGQVLLFATIGLIVTGTALLALGIAGHARPLVFGSLLCISLAVVPLVLFYGSGRPNVGSGTVREAAGVTKGPLVTPRPVHSRPAMASDECALPSPWPDANVGSQIAFSFNYSNSAFPVNRPGDDMWGTAEQFKVARAARVKMRVRVQHKCLGWELQFP